MRELTPAAVTGTLDDPGRPPAQAGDGAGVPRRFTVGDQLLWGAAEPLRRMLRILLEAMNPGSRIAPLRCRDCNNGVQTTRERERLRERQHLH